MALRAVPDHPKFSQLKARLRQPKGAVLGWLESIWHFAGRFTPQGNIGKYTDEAIEAWVEWDGKPGDLISALLWSGWLIESPVHRLTAWRWQYFSGLTNRGRRQAAIRGAGGEASHELRRRVYERDGRRCKQCGGVDDLTLDHIVPVSRFGMTSEDNLQTLCRRCNSAKGDRTIQ